MYVTGAGNLSEEYSVQSFSPIKGGVRPDNPEVTDTASSAMRVAEKRATTAAGAIAIYLEINDETGCIDSRTVLAIYGDLPEYILDEFVRDVV